MRLALIDPTLIAAALVWIWTCDTKGCPQKHMAVEGQTRGYLRSSYSSVLLATTGLVVSVLLLLLWNKNQETSPKWINNN